MENKRVLIVDDNDTFLELMNELLAARGYKISKAKNGIEALEIARREKFDLVLLDLLLPKMTGFDVLKAMREHDSTRDTTVLAVSGVFRKDEQLSYLRELGAAGFIPKSFTPVEIAERVERLLQAPAPEPAPKAEAKRPGFDLANFALFKDLSEAQREKLLGVSKVVSFKDGQEIVREGEEGDRFYGIVSGRVLVEKNEVGGGRAVIAFLGPGHEFGELALIDSDRRSATCRAEGEVEAIEISRSGFERALKEDTDLELKCLRALLKVLADRLRQTDVSLTFSRTLLDRTIEPGPSGGSS